MLFVDLKVADHWQQLMLKMEDRLKLVNASVAFYKTSEQVFFYRCSVDNSSSTLIISYYRGGTR